MLELASGGFLPGVACPVILSDPAIIYLLSAIIFQMNMLFLMNSKNSYSSKHKTEEKCLMNAAINVNMQYYMLRNVRIRQSAKFNEWMGDVVTPFFVNLIYATSRCTCISGHPCNSFPGEREIKLCTYF